MYFQGHKREKEGKLAVLMVNICLVMRGERPGVGERGGREESDNAVLVLS